MLTVHERLKFTSPKHQRDIKGTHLAMCLTSFFSKKCDEIHLYYPKMGSYENYEKRFDSLLNLNNLFREFSLNHNGHIDEFLGLLDELHYLADQAKKNHRHDRPVETVTKEYMAEIETLKEIIKVRRTTYSLELNHIKSELTILLSQIDELRLATEALCSQFNITLNDKKFRLLSHLLTVGQDKIEEVKGFYEYLDNPPDDFVKVMVPLIRHELGDFHNESWIEPLEDLKEDNFNDWHRQIETAAVAPTRKRIPGHQPTIAERMEAELCAILLPYKPHIEQMQKFADKLKTNVTHALETTAIYECDKI